MNTIARFGWLVAAALAGTGCGTSQHESAPLPTATAIRAARRLYDGAPPVIPHAPLQIKCTACHTETGRETPPLGLAPANPHGTPVGAAATANCTQCHVFRRDDSLFAASEFQGLRPVSLHGERLYATAPPVIPHALLMRENCLACHAGLAARPEIRCTHPQRSICRQCHAESSDVVAPPELSIALPPSIESGK